MTMVSLSMTATCTGGQCSLRRPCRPCPEGSRRIDTLPLSLGEDCSVALHQRGRIPNGSAQPSLRRSGRVGPYGKSRPLSDQEYRSALGLGGENRITHSTLHTSATWGAEDPQKSAILGPRRGSRGGRKGLGSCGPQQRGFLERSYINHLASRPVDLLATWARV